MTLSHRYNNFYESNLQKEQLQEVIVKGWPKDRIEALIAVEGAGDTILDIGCGNGQLLYQFRNRYKKLIGLEYSSIRLQQAVTNLEGFNFVPVLGSAEKLESIQSGTVDRILSADTIEHIPDIYAAFDEFCRVLKPGGTIVINTPNIAFFKKRLLLLIGRFPATSQMNEGLGSDLLFDGGHLHYFTFRSLRLLLEKSGFCVVRNTGYGKFGRIQAIWPSLLSGGIQWLAIKPK